MANARSGRCPRTPPNADGNRLEEAAADGFDRDRSGIEYRGFDSWCPQSCGELTSLHFGRWRRPTLERIEKLSLSIDEVLHGLGKEAQGCLPEAQAAADLLRDLRDNGVDAWQGQSCTTRLATALRNLHNAMLEDLDALFQNRTGQRGDKIEQMCHEASVKNRDDPNTCAWRYADVIASRRMYCQGLFKARDADAAKRQVEATTILTQRISHQGLLTLRDLNRAMNRSVRDRSESSKRSAPSPPIRHSPTLEVHLPTPLKRSHSHDDATDAATSITADLLSIMPTIDGHARLKKEGEALLAAIGRATPFPADGAHADELRLFRHQFQTLGRQAKRLQRFVAGLTERGLADLAKQPEIMRHAWALEDKLTWGQTGIERAVAVLEYFDPTGTIDEERKRDDTSDWTLRPHERSLLSGQVGALETEQEARVQDLWLTHQEALQTRFMQVASDSSSFYDGHERRQYLKPEFKVRRLISLSSPNHVDAMRFLLRFDGIPRAEVEENERTLSALGRDPVRDLTRMNQWLEGCATQVWESTAIPELGAKVRLKTPAVLRTREIKDVHFSSEPIRGGVFGRSGPSHCIQALAILNAVKDAPRAAATYFEDGRKVHLFGSGSEKLKLVMSASKTEDEVITAYMARK